MRRRLPFLTFTVLLALGSSQIAHAPGAFIDGSSGGPAAAAAGASGAADRYLAEPSGQRRAPVGQRLASSRTAFDRHARDPLRTQSRRGLRRRQAALARLVWVRELSRNRQRERDLQAALAQAAWYGAAAQTAVAATAQKLPAANGPPAAPAADVGPAPVNPQGRLVSVRGIVVDAGIADRLQALLARADAAGIGLSGSGYRDPAAQRRLREQHCPDPVNSPPSACTPSTARPGESMHEQGVAIDFTFGGSIISSHASAAYQWLNANAAQFGFINLPSEPWHWSINGR